MKKLFAEFKAATALDWKNQIIKDLKGEAYESLQWQNENCFVVEPFYTSESLSQNYLPAFTHNDWELSVNVKSQNAAAVNHQLLTSLDMGASSFYLNIAQLDLNVALRAVKLNYINAAFEINKDNVNQLRTYFETHYDLNNVNASVFYENFNSLKSIEEWHRTMAFFLDFKKIKALSFNALPYHNLNPFAYYEVAIIFSGLIEQLEYLRTKGEIYNADLVVKTGVNSDFFTQIAKLRAIRRLWNCFKEEYQLSNQLYLIAETTITNKSIADKHNNLLRSSIEAMAAVAGGCNELIVNDFDVFNVEKDKAANRLSINQQLILKHESYLDKMADVACGSYYIENLTDAIAEKALQTFKYFEEQGGYLACIEKNVFNTEIAKQANTHQVEFDSNKKVVIGVNKFKNEKEAILLSQEQLQTLKQLPINNPVLNYELQNNLGHA